MRTIVFWHTALLSMITLALALHTPPAHSDTVDTSQLQAAFVYNFMLFAQWSSVPNGTDKVLCTAGQNRESLSLKSLEGRDLHEAHLRVTSISNDAELAQCHALFVASTEFSHFFDLTAGKPILVLSNVQPDNGRTAAIVLWNLGNRVVFDIDLPTLNKSNVKLAASVLRLAKNIRE